VSPPLSFQHLKTGVHHRLLHRRGDEIAAAKAALRGGRARGKSCATTLPIAEHAITSDDEANQGRKIAELMARSAAPTNDPASVVQTADEVG